MLNYYINTEKRKSKINKEIYGHFSEHLGRCIYEGIYVGEESKIPNVNGMRIDVVEAMKKINIPVLRWPGGCFADEYHWKDGIGEKSLRNKMVNTHWGGVVEDNSFGTHEFFELCKQLECEPYINGNVGSGTVQEMQEWVEYMTFDGISPMAKLRGENGQDNPWKVKYFGVGNENWGCGGNMTPEYYANEYRRYQTYVRNYGENRIYKIACGANIDDYNWTEILMKNANNFFDGLTMHYYTIPSGDFWNKGGTSLEFDKVRWYETLKQALRIEELIMKHSQIMDKYDPQKRVGLIVDEWGIWCDSEPGTNPGFLYQQNSMRDALVAGISLNIFNKHSDRVTMANLAQVVNVLQAIILTEGEKMILTPTYHVFDMYKNHQDAELVESFIQTKEIGNVNANAIVPNIVESASIDSDENLNITICNLSIEEGFDIAVNVTGREYTSIEATILHNDMNAHNTFEETDNVKPEKFTNFKLEDNKINLTIPECSIIHLKVK